MNRSFLWFLLLASAAGLGIWLWRWQQRFGERRRQEDARMASFVAEAAMARPSSAPEEKMLFEAAAKAAQAGEPALSIQLYARLIARFPAGPLAAQARAAVEVQKKSLAIARAPGTSARG